VEVHCALIEHENGKTKLPPNDQQQAWFPEPEQRELVTNYALARAIHF